MLLEVGEVLVFDDESGFFIEELLPETGQSDRQFGDVVSDLGISLLLQHENDLVGQDPKAVPLQPVQAGVSVDVARELELVPALFVFDIDDSNRVVTEGQNFDVRHKLRRTQYQIDLYQSPRECLGRSAEERVVGL